MFTALFLFCLLRSTSKRLIRHGKRVFWRPCSLFEHVLKNGNAGLKEACLGVLEFVIFLILLAHFGPEAFIRQWWFTHLDQGGLAEPFWYCAKVLVPFWLVKQFFYELELQQKNIPIFRPKVEGENSVEWEANMIPALLLNTAFYTTIVCSPCLPFYPPIRALVLSS